MTARLRLVLITLLLWRVARLTWPRDIRRGARAEHGQVLLGGAPGFVVVYADLGGVGISPRVARDLAKQLERAARIVEQKAVLS